MIEDMLLMHQAVQDCQDCTVPTSQAAATQAKSATIDIPGHSNKQEKHDLADNPFSRTSFNNDHNSFYSDRSSFSPSGFLLAPLLMKCQSMPARGMHSFQPGQQGSSPHGVSSGGGHSNPMNFGGPSFFEKGLPLGAQKFFEGKH